MQMLKYRPKGDVQAAELTEKNAQELAEASGGALFISPRTSKPYVLLETDEGTQRADLGDYLVQEGEGKKATWRAVPVEVFTETFQRP